MGMFERRLEVVDDKRSEEETEHMGRLCCSEG